MKGLELELERLNRKIRKLDACPAQPLTLEKKLELEQKKSELEKLRNEKSSSLLADRQKIERNRTEAINRLENSLDDIQTEIRPLIEIQWEIVSSFEEEQPDRS